MKIIRYQDKTGAIRYGYDDNGTHRVLEGDIFGDFSRTDEPCEIAKLLAPVEPKAFLGIGLNYRQHAVETGAPIPQNPILFLKSPGALCHPHDAIQLPRHLRSDQVDYECELAVVIGKTGKNIRREDALNHVLGYCCANDVSARDWQKEPAKSGSQWCRAKTFDTFAPLGPCLVTTDEIPNPNVLQIKTILNGETVQDWNTDDMIFDVPHLIAFLSGSTTLMAGTVILTGTPQGVGMARTPPLWMKAGDTVSVEIENIGTLTNPVVDEA